MSFIKKKINEAVSNEPISAASIALMKRQMRRHILMMTAALLVVCVSAAAFISHAWFAMNRDVTSNDNAIVSDAGGPSLFIRDASDSSKQNADVITKTTGASLFPISTPDLSDWYYASSFTISSQEVAGSGYTYTVNTPIANAYTKIASFTDADAGTYANSYEGRTVTAYYKSEVNLYTSGEELDVYLNSANPITVAYDTTNETVAKNLLDCLRVGIEVGGSKLLIYAPLAESGTGNSQGSSADTFYYITEVSSTPTLTAANSSGTNVYTSSTLAPFLAQQIGTSDLYETTANTTTPICTADGDGTDVTVYVWLEGTDAQALYGLSDNDLKGISVTVNYVGVETD